MSNENLHISVKYNESKDRKAIARWHEIRKTIQKKMGGGYLSNRVVISILSQEYAAKNPRQSNC